MKKWLDTRNLFQSILIGLIGVLIGGIILFFVLQRIFPTSGPGDLFRYVSTALGVLALGGTAVVQYRKQKNSEESVALERDMQFATRLTKAVEHLGSESRAIRNGGLHELQRLAKDSDKDRIPVIEIMVQFIKNLQHEYANTGDSEKYSELRSTKTLFCALLRQLKPRQLHGADFSGIALVLADLREADLSGVNLSSANLSGANH